MPFGGWLMWVQGTILDGTQILHRKKHFWGGHVPAHCNVPMHECIAHCSPAASDECGCTAHAADECKRAVARRRCGLLPNYFGHLLIFHFWWKWKMDVHIPFLKFPLSVKTRNKGRYTDLVTPVQFSLLDVNSKSARQCQGVLWLSSRSLFLQSACLLKFSVGVTRRLTFPTSW